MLVEPEFEIRSRQRTARPQSAPKSSKWDENIYTAANIRPIQFHVDVALCRPLRS